MVRLQSWWSGLSTWGRIAAIVAALMVIGTVHTEYDNIIRQHECNNAIAANNADPSHVNGTVDIDLYCNADGN